MRYIHVVIHLFICYRYSFFYFLFQSIYIVILNNPVVGIQFNNSMFISSFFPFRTGTTQNQHSFSHIVLDSLHFPCAAFGHIEIVFAVHAQTAGVVEITVFYQSEGLSVLIQDVDSEMFVSCQDPTLAVCGNAAWIEDLGSRG